VEPTALPSPANIPPGTLIKTAIVKSNIPSEVPLEIGMMLLPEALSKLESLLSRTPEVRDYSGFRELLDFKDAPADGTVESNCADVVFGLANLMFACRRLTERSWEELMDTLVQKIRSKGGPKARLDQVVDAIYECHVYIHIETAGIPVEFCAEIATGSPDLVVPRLFHYSTEPIRLAVECKNLTKYRSNIPDLAREIAGAVSAAKTQFEKRKESQTLADWVVFVDLPLAWYLERQLDCTDYCQAVCLARQTLTAQLESSYDDARVVFTATSQTGMVSTLLKFRFYDSVLLPPVVTGDVWLGGPRAVFLSFFFAEEGENANIFNWGKRAIFVENWTELNAPSRR